MTNTQHDNQALADAGAFCYLMMLEINVKDDLNPTETPIYLLDDWQTSAGARAEFALAEKLGLKVISQESVAPNDATNLRAKRLAAWDIFNGYLPRKFL